MKIITRYILREHAGPMAFAFVALTSLMLLNFISRQFGELVGKGLPWSVIGEFFLLSLPFTIALTVPMSVLVAVLYAFSRLAAENEVTAFKASGVSPWRLVSPAVWLGILMSVLLLAFNDQVLPRANHRLKTLQDDISQTKPTLLLKEQVINTVAEGRLYLKAGKIDAGGRRLKEVVIYDLANPQRRRTIYADSGNIAFAPNQLDLDLDLFHGQMQEVSTDKPEQLDRLFYAHDRVRVKDVGHVFNKTTKIDPNTKGDREMGICEMQRRLWSAEQQYQMTVQEYKDATDPKKQNVMATSAPSFKPIKEPHGLGWAYCSMFRLLGVKELHAEALPTLQDTVKRDSARQDTIKKAVQQAPVLPPGVVGQPVTTLGGGTPAAVPAGGQAATMDSAALAKEQVRIAAEAAAALMRAKAAVIAPADPLAGLNSRGVEARIRLDMTERSRNRFQIEIHKKFSLAAACLIFCILAPPIALRFPRGGVGLVIGVSLAVFALYYVGLIGGEAAANHGYVPPFWAMWGMNVILTVLGFYMLFRIGRDSGSTRGGGIREWLDTRRMLREERRAATRGT